MSEEIAQAIIPHIPTIVAATVSLIVSIITCLVVVITARKEKIKKEFEREYGEPISFDKNQLAKDDLSEYLVLIPGTHKAIPLDNCQFVQKKGGSTKNG